MSSQIQTDLNCCIGRCLLSSIDPNRTENLDRLLVAIRTYGQDFGGLNSDISKCLDNDIETERLFPGGLTFLTLWFADDNEEEIRECLTLECSRFSTSALQENHNNLESNIKKCREKIHKMKESRELKNDKLLAYIKLKEKSLEDLIHEREEEITELKKFLREGD